MTCPAPCTAGGRTGTAGGGGASRCGRPRQRSSKVPGEDYTQVPRTPRETPAAGTEYVLATDTRDTPPTMELHRTGCWAIETPAKWRRITPVPTPAEARGALGFPDTTACEACNPTP